MSDDTYRDRAAVEFTGRRNFAVWDAYTEVIEDDMFLLVAAEKQAEDEAVAQAWLASLKRRRDRLDDLAKDVRAREAALRAAHGARVPRIEDRA